jgi:general secretion pathway protein D
MPPRHRRLAHLRPRRLGRVDDVAETRAGPIDRIGASGGRMTVFVAAKRARSAATAAFVLLATALALGTPAGAAPRVSTEHAETYTFAFHDADISQVAAEILGKALSLSYSVDPGVTGKMSFQIDRRLTGAQLLEAFEAALETNGCVLVREGNSLMVEPRSKAKGASKIRGVGEGVHGAGYSTMAVPLAYAVPSEVAKALQSIGPADVVVYVDDKLGLLILGGSGSELDAAVELVRTFDHSGLEDSKIRFFELQQASSQTVAGDLDKILSASGISGVTVVPLKRLNGLFIFARTASTLDSVGRWIEKLDTPSKEKTLSLWVYHPRNLAADSLAATLGGVLSTQSSVSQTSVTSGHAGAPAAEPASGGAPPPPALTSQTSTILSTDDDPVRVGVDKQSNALLFSASPARWVQIQKILDEIDKTPDQVLIEASILEVTLSDERDLGVDWSIMGAGGRLNAGNINNGTSTVSATFPGVSVTFLDKDIKAAVNALSSKSAVEVVSAPKIVALDNHTAKLDVGDQVPVTTQSAQSTSGSGSPIVNTVDYRSTGIILNVTPRIGGDDRILLEIEQEVSSVANTTTSGIDSPTIQQRKISTTLILDNGGVVALGGLIGTNRSSSDTGIPFLSQIPYAGALFKTHTKKATRTELIVLITAKIIRDKASSQRVMNDLIADMHEINRRGLFKQ